MRFIKSIVANLRHPLARVMIGLVAVLLIAAGGLALLSFVAQESTEASAFYEGLLRWQSGLAAYLGIAGLIVAAFYNAGLERGARREDRLRKAVQTSLALSIEISKICSTVQWVKEGGFTPENPTDQVQAMHELNNLARWRSDTFERLVIEAPTLGHHVLLKVTRFWDHISSIKDNYPANRQPGMNDALRLLDLADRAFEARAATRLHAVEAQTELKRVDPSGEI